MALIAFALAANPFRGAAQTPSTLVPPTGNVEVARWLGVGAQNYVSVPLPDDATRFMWRLKAPIAVLLNGGGRVVGTHFGGPTWESNNGSQVIGQRVALENAPDPSAIPWLLLQGVDHAGHGMFGAVTYIQRLYTTGGQPPAQAPMAEGIEVSVPYTAVYVFFEAAG